MIPRSLADTRRWAKDGLVEFHRVVAELSVADLDEPSRLPEWHRRHVIAHVAANADALHNLMSWAATGVPTPMYASTTERSEGILRGARLRRVELLTWLGRSSARLEEDFDRLSPECWDAVVVTAQGREVPATEVPWLRARELWVHAVDLRTTATFDAMPEDVLLALAVDVVTKRSSVLTGPAVVIDADGHRWTLPGTGNPARVHGSLPQAVAYLTGRAHRMTGGHAGVPRLGAWL